MRQRTIRPGLGKDIGEVFFLCSTIHDLQMERNGGWKKSKVYMYVGKRFLVAGVRRVCCTFFKSHVADIR